MAKFERYEPRGDSSRVFDGAEVEDEGEEGSRVSLLLVIGLLVVAAFAGVVWLAYTQGVQRGRADAPRMLVAANGPVKEAPVNPGGAETPFKGLKIYQQPAPSEEDDVESAPQPPTPKVAETTPPPSATQARPSGPARPVATPAAAQTKPAKAVKLAQTTAPQVEQAPAKPAPVAASTGAEPVATKPPRALGAQPSPTPKAVATPKTVAAPKPAAVETAPLPKPATHAAPAEASAEGGSALLQIGAYKSEDEANAAWQSFTHKHPLASSYRSDVKKVDLGDKGVWYRLRLGDFADKDAASAFCDKLKADGATCFPAR